MKVRLVVYYYANISRCAVHVMSNERRTLLFPSMTVTVFWLTTPCSIEPERAAKFPLPFKHDRSFHIQISLYSYIHFLKLLFSLA